MSQPKITIYTKIACPFCIHAIQLLKSKNVKFEEFDAAYNAPLKQEMIEKSGGRRTFPQIFINEKHVGGCDELVALDKAGELDKLLSINE